MNIVRNQSEESREDVQTQYFSCSWNKAFCQKQDAAILSVHISPVHLSP